MDELLTQFRDAEDAAEKANEGLNLVAMEILGKIGYPYGLDDDGEVDEESMTYLRGYMDALRDASAQPDGPSEGMPVALLAEDDASDQRDG